MDDSILEELSIGTYIVKSSLNSFPKDWLEKIIRTTIKYLIKLLCISFTMSILNDKRNYRK